MKNTALYNWLTESNHMAFTINGTTKINGTIKIYLPKEWNYDLEEKELSEVVREACKWFLHGEPVTIL